MADLETIRIPVDSSDFSKAVSQAKSLENTISKLYNALDKGTISTSQFKEGLRQLNSQNTNLFGSVQKTTAEIWKYAASVESSVTTTKADKAAKAEFETTLKSNRLALATLNAERKAEVAASKEAAATAKAEAAVRKNELLAALNSVRMGINNLNAERKAEAAAAQIQIAADKALTAEKQRLIAQYNPVIASMQLYATEQANIKRATELGIITDEQKVAELARLKKEYDDYSNGAMAAGNRFANGATRGTKAMNGMSMATQQFGYQVGDFLVQWQSGTNVLVAFGQQATQLVGILPMMASGIGLSMTAAVALSAGLGIVIPLVTAIGAAWMRVSEKNNKATKATEEFQKKLEELDKTLQDWVMTKKAADLGISVDELISEDAVKQAEDRVNKLRTALSKVTSQGVSGRTTKQAQAGITEAENALIEAQTRLADIRTKQQEDLNKKISEELITSQQNLALNQTILKYGKDSAEVQAMQNAQELANYERKLDEMGITGDTYDLLVRNKEETLAAGNAIDGAATSAKSLKEQLQDAASALSNLTTFGQGLDKQLAVVTAQVTALKNGTNAAVAGSIAGMRTDLKKNTDEALAAARAAGQDTLGIMAESAIQSATITELEKGLSDKASLEDSKKKKPKKSTAGSAANSESKLQGYLANVQSYISENTDSPASQLEAQLAEDQAAYDKKIAQLQAFLEKKQVTQQEFQDIESKLTEAHEQAQQEIVRKHREEQLSYISGFFNNLSSLMDSKSRALFEIGKVAAIAQATVDGWAAATSAWKWGMRVGGPVVAAAFSAASIAKTAVQIANIKATSFGSSSSSSSSSASSSTSSVDSSSGSSAQTVYLSGLTADQLFTGEQLQNLFDSLYNENNSRGQVFVVAR